MNALEIELVKGDTAPRYPEGTTVLECSKVAITEKGTEANLPIVDFVCTDTDGKKYFLALSGRIVNGIAAAVRGVNERNHGKSEP